MGEEGVGKVSQWERKDHVLFCQFSLVRSLRSCVERIVKAEGREEF